MNTRFPHVHQPLVAELEQRGIEVLVRHQRAGHLEIDSAPRNGERRRGVLDHRRKPIQPGQDEAFERGRDDRGAIPGRAHELAQIQRDAF